MNEPQKTFNDLEGSKFRKQVQSFVCVQTWRCVTFKFWEMLKNASEVTLVQKNIFFFLKIWNLVQSFVKCKVSLADCILLVRVSQFFLLWPIVMRICHDHSGWSGAKSRNDANHLSDDEGAEGQRTSWACRRQRGQWELIWRFRRTWKHAAV